MADSEDRAASGLQALATAIRPRLLRFLVARLGNHADAEDVLQDLWLRLEHHRGGPVTSGEAYLHKIALNLANDLVRQRHRGQVRDGAWHDANSGDGPQQEADPAPSQERTLDARQQLARVESAIAAMPERARDVFRRQRIMGESHADIAASLGITKSAVEKHMATAMRHLAEMLFDGEED